MDHLHGCRLLKIIGKGSHSIVFDAFSSTGRSCVLKITDPAQYEQWDNEKKIALKLDRLKSRRFFSCPMEFIRLQNPWRSLNINPWISNSSELLVSMYPRRQVLMDHFKPMSLKIRRIAVIHILYALREMNKAGVIHNDVHFGNILFETTAEKKQKLLKYNLPSTNYQFCLIDYDRSLLTKENKYNMDILHFIFSLTNKDQVIQEGGFLTPSQLCAFFRTCKEWSCLVQHLSKILPFPTTKYMNCIRGDRKLKKTEEEEFYIVLLVLETLYSTLYRKKDCRMRNIVYTPLFVPKEDIMAALYKYQDFNELLGYFCKKK